MSKAERKLPKLVTRASYARWPMVKIDIGDGEIEEFPDYTGIAVDYCERVVTGKQIACRWVILACKRFLKMREQATKARSAFYWSDAHVADVCSFIEKLPHVKGEWGSSTIVLEPCQMFWLAAIFGFRRRESGVRLVRDVLLFVPRKNGKSALVSGISLYCLTCEGEIGPEVRIGASTLEQAGHVFEPSRAIIRVDEDIREHFALRETERGIFCGLPNGGNIKTVTSIASAQDGHNPHLVVLEELHAQNHGLFQVMGSAFGARKNPLMFKITTAGRTASGLCWEQLKKAERLLRGLYAAPNEFAIIYTVDKADREKYFEIESAIKANPMWGTAVQTDIVREEIKGAQNDPSKRSEFLRTRLNVWSNAAEAIIQIEDWDRCEDKKLTLAQFEGQKCWIGVDLASKRDMAAVALIFELPNDKLAVFAQFYVPDDAPGFSDPDLQVTYEEWDKDGVLIKTGVGIIDQNWIKRDVIAFCDRFDVQVIAFDPYQANMLSSSLIEAGKPALTFSNNAKNMAEPTDDLKSRVEANKICHPGHPILTWNAMNVVGYRDQKGNILPKKDAVNSPRKIDGIHAAIFANGCRLQSKKPDEDEIVKPHPWAVRGLLGMDTPDAPEAQQ